MQARARKPEWLQTLHSVEMGLQQGAAAGALVDSLDSVDDHGIAPFQCLLPETPDRAAHGKAVDQRRSRAQLWSVRVDQLQRHDPLLPEAWLRLLMKTRLRLSSQSAIDSVRR